MFGRFFLILSLTAGLPALAQSPAVHPVPGSGAAYLYFPAEGDGATVLKVIKENVTSVPAGIYEVFFTFDGGLEEPLCDSTQTECEKTLKPGTVKLRIAGNWIPDKLPMSGKFSGACSGIDTTCQFALQANATNTVRIKAGCNARDYSVVKLGGDAEALCIGISLDNQNDILLAAHQDTASGKRPKNKKSLWGYDSNDDGKANTQTIMNNWTSSNTTQSAAHHCANLSIGSGGGKMMDWYLPAINELELALNGWDDADPIITRYEDGYYSSTESGKKYTRIIRWSSSSGKQKTTKKYKDTNGETLCVHSVSP